MSLPPVWVRTVCWSRINNKIGGRVKGTDSVSVVLLQNLVPCRYSVNEISIWTSVDYTFFSHFWSFSSTGMQLLNENMAFSFKREQGSLFWAKHNWSWPPQKNEFRVLCVTYSTTETTFLSQNKRSHNSRHLHNALLGSARQVKAKCRKPSYRFWMLFGDILNFWGGGSSWFALQSIYF